MTECDYVINVGKKLDTIEPHETAMTKADAITRAMKLAKRFKFVDVVFAPQDDFNVNEIVWKNY